MVLCPLMVNIMLQCNVSTNMWRSNMKFYNLSFFSGCYCFDEFFGKS